HFMEEEHVFLLEGALTVRIGAERHAMKAGDYVCFPAGQKAGHCLVNDSGAVCRYVIMGERNGNDVVVYPDSRKLLARALGGVILDLDAVRGYWHGEDLGLPGGAGPSRDEVRVAPTAPEAGKPPIASEAMAWDEFRHGNGFVDRNKHLTRAAVGEG